MHVCMYTHAYIHGLFQMSMKGRSKSKTCMCVCIHIFNLPFQICMKGRWIPWDACRKSVRTRIYKYVCVYVCQCVCLYTHTHTRMYVHIYER